MSGLYAKKTKVTIEKSRTEIERLLQRYGATRYVQSIEPDRGIILFEAHDRRLRFDLPLPKAGSPKADAERRRRWRALTLSVKAKLESVASGIETFEQAFYANIVLPNGLTVYQASRDAVEIAYKTGGTPALLLPDYSNK